MTTKRFLISWLGTTVIIFILNGLFHGLIAADFFDRNTASLGSAVLKMADFNPAPVALLELIITFCLTWIFSKTSSANLTMQDAVIIGGLFHLAASATWSLANMATFVSWPLQLAVGDIAWHVLMGLISGWLIYRLGLKQAT